MATNLKDVLRQQEQNKVAAKAEEQIKKAETVELKVTAAENRTEPPTEIEAQLPDDPPAPEHAFRVFNHRYEFKVGGKVVKPNEKNIYTPENLEEFNFLRLQVERGLIHFY